jgi:intein/homing endonuclease
MEKPLSDLKNGDFLILPEKINLNLEDQKINFEPIIRQKFNFKNIKIPEKINSELSRILGYYLGDGNYEQDRITFSEQREEIVLYYKNLIENLFGIEGKIKFRESKGYYQLSVYSRALTQLFALFFGTERKTLNGEIPKQILMSSDCSLASFIAGFFDAEGYVSNNRVAFGINNERLAKQIQFALLRLGIIASVNEYDNRRNPYSYEIRYTLAIDDLESLKNFKEIIGFASKEKQLKVKNLISKRSSRNKVRQLVVNGKDVARIIRNSGLDTTRFNCPSFFVNEREMSKEIFKNKILSKIDNLDLRRRLELFYNSNLIIAKIAKIESIGESKTIDIETKNHNFIANGILVHNSSQRYERIVEGKAKDFYRECAEMLKKHFFELKNLKGILIGGPMPTKDEFLKEGLLVTALKNKIIGMKDIGYADEHGIELLVEGSQDLLQQQAIIKEKQLMEKFFNMLGKQKEKTAYGLEPVQKALNLAAVDTLLLSRKLDKKIIAELKEKAESISANVEFVSVETEEGEQFFNLSGIGAILRYALE